MKILFLGTAAAEGIPSPFCECSTCTHARKAGGHNVRMRTSALVNDDLLFDCGPDLVAATQRFGVRLSRLETLLVTHAHKDHLLPSNLAWRGPGFCPTPITPLHIFGPGPVTRAFRRNHHYWSMLAEKGAVSLETVRAGQRWQSGQYQITALSATHDSNRTALLYIVSNGTRKLFYATDSGPLSERAWHIVAREAPFDAVLMEETMGRTPRSGDHHNMESFLRAHRRFVGEGWLTRDAPFVAFHFSHQSNPPHDELVRYLAPHGVLVAYDGMELTLTTPDRSTP
ncbi:MAG: MBL fold metallo-hydrolase [Anaerolineae bacterium]